VPTPTVLPENATMAEPASVLPARGPDWVRAALLVAAPLALAATTVALTVRTGYTASVYTLLPSTAAIGGVGALLAGLRPRYAGGWLMLATGIAFLVGQLAEQVAFANAGEPVAQTAAWVATWIYPPALVPLFVLVPLTFPDGRLPSPRWRWLVVVAAGLIVASALASGFLTPTLAPVDGQAWPNPYALALADRPSAVPGLVGLATLAAAVAAATSLVVRWRGADRPVRRQILWVVLALLVMVLAFAVDAASALLAPSTYAQVVPVVQLVPIVLPLAIAVAVLRHQLFDIEVVVGRTVVYGLLTAALVLVYATVLAVAGATLPAGGEGIAPVLAVALVAVAFAPLRDWLQRQVRRRLYGDRAQPYAALVRISRELSATSTPRQLQAALVTCVADSLKAPYVSLAFDTGGQLTGVVESGTRPPSEGRLISRDLQHGGERVGRLVLAQRGRDTYTRADLRLLDALTLPIGAAMHALRLSEQVRQSREQLVRSVEEERRRLGRDLHDSLGPRLAAIGMQVEAAADLIRADPDKAVGLLAAVLDQTDQVLREARGIAHAHRPPTLDALGLVPALEVLLGQLASVPAALALPQPLPPLPAAVETAAYRIAAEALHNVAKHSDAHRCSVRIELVGDRLQLTVADDGAGLPSPLVPGVGVSSMRERAQELGGMLVVTAGPGQVGTVVRAVLPCAASVLAAQ
jgi:signal transduction histidine kinase